MTMRSTASGAIVHSVAACSSVARSMPGSRRHEEQPPQLVATEALHQGEELASDGLTDRQHRRQWSVTAALLGRHVRGDLEQGQGVAVGRTTEVLRDPGVDAARQEERGIERRQTIEVHGRETSREAVRIAVALGRHQQHGFVLDVAGGEDECFA